MSHSDDFDFGSDSSGGDSWDLSSLPSGSNLGCSSQNNQPHRPEAPGSIHAANLHTENPPGSSAAYPVSSTASTRSTGSYLYTTCLGQGVSSILPRIAESALGQPTGTDFDSSIDPILLPFASHSTSPAGQILDFDNNSALSSGNIDSGDTRSGSGGSNSQEEHQTSETPNTSETGHRDEDIFDLDQDPLDLDLNRAVFFGLEFPEELRRPLFPSTTNSENIGDLDQILEPHRNPQARPDAASWVPNIDIVPDPVEVAQAPSPGPTYNAYHSRIKQYNREPDEVCNEEKAINGRFREQSPSIGGSRRIVRGKPKSYQDVPLNSGNRMRSYHALSRDKQNTLIDLKRVRGVDSMSDSLITKVSLFHPTFLVSHLSEGSVSAFTVQMCGPNTYIDPSEHPVNISLGFGPDICFQASPFIPKDKQALRSFQKHEGDDILHVKDSLPIALNCFSVVLTAEVLDDWLDKIVNSPSHLLECANFIMKQHRESLSAKALRAIVSWFLTTNSKLSKLAQRIIRNALKLLLTITTLTLAPTVTQLPSSLSAYLPQWSSSGTDSNFGAPKLLTRQIKSSTYHLQMQLLRALFSDLVHGKGLVAQVKFSVALIVSFGLELVSDSARTFARYANKINQTVSVQDVEVEHYERNIERDVFDRIRSSVNGYRGADGRMDELGDRLRSICQSSRKGKEKEDRECRFVSAILAPVF